MDSPSPRNPLDGSLFNPLGPVSIDRISSRHVAQHTSDGPARNRYPPTDDLGDDAERRGDDPQLAPRVYQPATARTVLRPNPPRTLRTTPLPLQLDLPLGQVSPFYPLLVCRLPYMLTYAATNIPT